MLARPDCVHYGHLALEIQMALVEARVRGARLALLQASQPANPAVFDLVSPDVRIVRLGPLRHRWYLSGWDRRARHSPRQRWRDRTWNICRAEAERELARQAGDPRLPEKLREHLQKLKKNLPPEVGLLAGSGEVAADPYYRRRLLRERVQVQLHPQARARAMEGALELGITDERPIVTVHARESGFKAGQEVHDKVDLDARYRLARRDDTTRNIRIESYYDAIDFLVARGFTVVRVGDPTMRPVARRGVVDLATSPLRTPEL
jgi:hypothetical protein